MFVLHNAWLARVGRLAAAACLFPMLALPASASPLPTHSAPLPLREALKLAWEAHPTARATSAIQAATRARAEADGKPLYNPEVDLDLEREGADLVSTAGLSLTLDASGKRRVRALLGSARVDQAVAEAQVRRRDFTRKWFASWAALQTARQRVATGERRIALTSRFAGLAERQFTAEDISGLERDLALLARDEAQAEQSQLLAEQAEAAGQFRAVGGLPDAFAGLTLPSDSLPPPNALNSGIERLPEWRVAQAAMQVADRGIEVAKRNRIADPTIGLRGGRIDYGDLRDNVVGVSLVIPLYLRNSYRAEVVAARADADVAVAELARVGLELDAERRRATESYAAAQAAWTRWSSSRGTDIDRRAGLLERLWREGELSTADYLLQINQTLATALAGAELEARLWRSYTDYLAATGQLERWSGLEGTP